MKALASCAVSSGENENEDANTFVLSPPACFAILFDSVEVRKHGHPQQ
jgi:hypothetical protein